MYKKLPFQKKDFPAPKDLKRHQDVFRKPVQQPLIQNEFDDIEPKGEEDEINRNKN
jgi:hypothetical protein